MEEIMFKSDDLIVMSLINYFITEKNYNPMIIHGINDEIWLENLNEEYKIVRIVSHHIHNKEQLAFDKFKLGKIVKEVKKKTLSFKVKVLSIYTDIEDDKLLSKDDVLINKEEDINNPKLTNVFPNIVEKTKRDQNGLEYFIKVTDNINQKNEKKSKVIEKIFSYKKPIITYSLIFICIFIFILMYLLASILSTEDFSCANFLHINFAPSSCFTSFSITEICSLKISSMRFVPLKIKRIFSIEILHFLNNKIFSNLFKSFSL